MLEKSEAIKILNALGANQIPFNFYCDFLGESWCIKEVHDSEENSSFYFETSNQSVAYSSQTLNVKESSTPNSRHSIIKKYPVQFSTYRRAFDKVIHEMNIGNSFLTNLTFQTPIEPVDLEYIFKNTSAKYRLFVPDQFVVFSPETFIKIVENKIYSYPMKGTINAETPNAEKIILNDPKEKAEHVTIVDLMRNDLSRVAENITVLRFRYVEEIKTQKKNLLQVSSEVSGDLASNWKANLGTILAGLLPAGSISGAPKQETVKIIKRAENYVRGFYTGVCGHFDGETFDSGVMIRFIKKGSNGLANYKRESTNQFYYCSGGGITSFSNAEKEYQEMIDKIYLPLSLVQ